MPSPDTFALIALLALQQGLHYHEKQVLMDRLGKPAPPAKAPTRHVPQKTMLSATADGRELEELRKQIL